MKRLAMNGPVAQQQKRRIQISQPDTGEEEWLALREPLQTGWLTQGPKVAAFEKAFAAVTACHSPSR